MPRQPAALLTHPDLELGRQRRDVLATHGKALFGRQPVDGTLGIKDRVDPPHRLGREWCASDLGELEQFAPAMGPARCLGDRAGLASCFVEIVEPGISVRLQDPRVSGQVPVRVLGCAVPRIPEHRRRWCRPGKGPVVAHIGPEAGRDGLAAGHEWDGGVVAMQAFRRQDMGIDPRHQRRQHGRAGADPVGHGGDAQFNPFAGKGLALAVQRQVLAELGLQDHRQQVRPGPPAGDGVEWCRWLCDGLAGAATEPLPHGLDHLPAPGHHLERLRDILTQLGQLAAAAGAGRRQGRANGLAARREAGAIAAPLLAGLVPGLGRVLAGGRDQLVELEFQLVEQLAAALGGGAEPVMLELGDQQLEMRHHRLGARDTRLGLAARQLFGRKGGAQGGDIIGQGVRRGCHAVDGITDPRLAGSRNACRSALSRDLRAPCPLWVPPVDPVEHVGQLRTRDRHRAIRGRGPDESASFQSLGVERHAEPIMPDDFNQVAATAPKNVEITGMRIAPERLLCLQRQAIHAAPHVGMAHRQPDPDTGGNRDHPRSAAMIRRNAAVLIASSTRITVPSGKATSIRGEAAGAASARDVGVGRSVATCSGMNIGAGSATSTPCRACLRQAHSTLRLTSCRRATSTKHAPGRSASATIRNLSAARHCRRRSTPLMISMSQAAPVLNNAPTSVDKIRRQVQPQAGRRPSAEGYARSSPSDGKAARHRYAWEEELSDSAYHQPAQRGEAAESGRTADRGGSVRRGRPARVIAVDSSVLIAILRREPEARMPSCTSSPGPACMWWHRTGSRRRQPGKRSGVWQGASPGRAQPWRLRFLCPGQVLEPAPALRGQ
ncbi:hypothetical protein K469DRAFT_686407 [Zopfia rhizophila CBS 207.26]|uniref:Uncharacterized protein n=1 Tax=Zopfia rhizophila CBS 207.26 TaxID=1314779 RepID=A0A6A6D8N2_9PEZI|nr:hypothetical protein K469DRAFT_686407 [Zopfia rhizophila CBS 207.26]